MTTNLPAPRDEAPLAIDSVPDLHADHHDPQHQGGHQNLGVALLPLALIAFAVLAFVAVAWTLMAAT
ncbi:MAG: hypothetical protein ABI622_07690 [Chloroflexota bacterium]